MSDDPTKHLMRNPDMLVGVSIPRAELNFLASPMFSEHAKPGEEDLYVRIDIGEITLVMTQTAARNFSDVLATVVDDIAANDPQPQPPPARKP